jgi:hypothetical protein
VRSYEDRKVVRVAGPFTVESLSPHRVMVDGPEDAAAAEMTPSVGEDSNAMNEPQREDLSDHPVREQSAAPAVVDEAQGFRRLGVVSDSRRFWTSGDVELMVSFLGLFLEPARAGFGALRIPPSAGDAAKEEAGTWLMGKTSLDWLQTQFAYDWSPDSDRGGSKDCTLFFDLERLKAVWADEAGGPFADIAPKVAAYGRAWLSLKVS